MFVIVSSAPDIGSGNIKRELLKLAQWEEAGKFDDSPILRYASAKAQSAEIVLVTIKDLHIYSEGLDERIKKEIGQSEIERIKIECIIFISRHSSKTKNRTLTVHPVGNFGAAEVGGKPGELAPTNPHLMTRALRALNCEYKKLGRKKADYADKNASKENYAISFEATHHGPYLQTPAFFIEVGSEENAWNDAAACEVIAKAVLSTLTQGAKDNENDEENAESPLKESARPSLKEPVHSAPILIGIGGGHYAPRFSDAAMKKNAAFGHMIPAYAAANVTDAAVEKAIKNTPGASGIFVHRKPQDEKEIERLVELFKTRGIREISAEELG